MNRDLSLLQPYPFEKLAALKAEVSPPSHLAHISLAMGEPKNAPPAFVLQTLADNLSGIGQYPLTKGSDQLRETIAHWATRRFHLPENTLSPERHVLPVAGTREALFAIAQAVVTASPAARVVMPNPCYQIYEGAALLAGAQPYYLNCIEQNGFQPNFDQVPDHIWQDCELLYICSPGNPTGAVLDLPTLSQLIELADRFDFVIASDECYSELYLDENNPPPGLLQACAQLGRTNYERCVVFHSLSKRSNLPGLRSGFVAGDAQILQPFLKYRTYQGCALSAPTQMASIAAWQDESHVQHNRALYRARFEQVMAILGGPLKVSLPDAGFYLWPETPEDDALFAQQLYAQQNVTVVPGQFLGRASAAGNPGRQRVRIALVADLEECVEAAQRIREFVGS